MSRTNDTDYIVVLLASAIVFVLSLLIATSIVYVYNTYGTLTTIGIAGLAIASLGGGYHIEQRM